MEQERRPPALALQTIKEEDFEFEGQKPHINILFPFTETYKSRSAGSPLLG